MCLHELALCIYAGHWDYFYEKEKGAYRVHSKTKKEVLALRVYGKDDRTVVQSMTAVYDALHIATADRCEKSFCSARFGIQEINLCLHWKYELSFNDLCVEKRSALGYVCNRVDALTENSPGRSLHQGRWMAQTAIVV